MGYGLFDYISQSCSSLAATTAPTVSAMGLNMVISLATIMMVWFGIQEALSSAQGGSGFNMAKFLNFVMLISFAYAFVKYYDATIPGLDFSLRGYIDGGATNLAQIFGAGSSASMLNQIHTASAKLGTGPVSSFISPYNSLVFFTIQVLLATLAAVVSLIIAYGAIASTIIGLLGPVFIPWLVFKQTDWLFWGWLKAYLGFTFYKVVAAATLSVLGQVMTNYWVYIGTASDPAVMVQIFPMLILLTLVNVYILIKIPAMTSSLFGGHTGGHDAGIGMAMMALRAGL